MTISDLEEYVLSLCPYRPLCLNSIFEADNESSIMLKDNYESTGITMSKILHIFSKSNPRPLAVRGSLSKFVNMEIVELFSTKNDSNLFAFERETETNFVHKKAVESIVANCKELLDQKQKEDPTWNVISYQEFTELGVLKNQSSL